MTRQLISTFSLLAASAIVAAASACPPDPPSADPHPHKPFLKPVIAIGAVAEQRNVDLAICLDTSGSMQGLIEAAKIKLWNIVNDLALAKPEPKLRVALLTYGNDGHSQSDGWVRIDSAFTDDLDLISQQLFALKTNGGTELVGRVLDAAHKKLQWTPGDEALKLIVVAGNESADQDREMSFRDVCKSIIGQGIMVNSIYCGNPADNIAPGWREVATLADGHFAAIDHNNEALAVATPFDDELVSLSAALNGTYLPFGKEGARYAYNQTAQDANAHSLGAAVAAERCSTKGGALYWNAQWDLVDACKTEGFKLEELKDDELPEALRGMTLEQRRAHIAQKQSEREDLQAKVAAMTAKRQEFVAKEVANAAEKNENSFDAAIRRAIRAQAASKGFEFQERKAAEKPDNEKSAS